MSARSVAALAVVVYGFMLVEAAVARRNERAQRTRGGIEPEGDVYQLMRIAYPGAFGLMIAEGFWRAAVPSAAVAPTVITGAAVFAAAKALKWWAIASLGSAWTFRVLVVPGMTLVREGPYRFLRHPNYAAVLGELVGAALMAGAAITGPIATIGFGVLIARRVAVEQRALDAILRR